MAEHKRTEIIDFDVSVTYLFSPQIRNNVDMTKVFLIVFGVVSVEVTRDSRLRWKTWAETDIPDAHQYLHRLFTCPRYCRHSFDLIWAPIQVDLPIREV